MNSRRDFVVGVDVVREGDDGSWGRGRRRGWEMGGEHVRGGTDGRGHYFLSVVKKRVFNTDSKGFKNSPEK